MSFGEKLQYIRVRMGLNQSDMAKLLGTTRQTINRYEHSQREPNIRTAAKFAEKLGVSVEELTDSQYDVPMFKSDLSPEQLEFLTLYEAASPDIQQAVRTVLAATPEKRREK